MTDYPHFEKKVVRMMNLPGIVEDTIESYARFFWELESSIVVPVGDPEQSADEFMGLPGLDLFESVQLTFIRNTAIPHYSEMVELENKWNATSNALFSDMLKSLGGDPDAQQPDLQTAGFDKEIIGMGIEELHQLIESEMSAQ